MSRYPTTEELAALRRSIARRFYTVDPLAHPPYATDDELRHGIGYRDDDWLGGSAAPVGFRYTFARRKASAMRSRAYARGIGSLADRETFAPSWNPYIDGERECTHDDPCEVGCIGEDFWEDDEPRQPLPVIYHQSVTIAPTA